MISGMPWNLMPLWKNLRHTLEQIPRHRILLNRRTTNRMADALAKLEEENQSPEVHRRENTRYEHSKDVLRRRNAEQPHLGLAETSDQNVIACNDKGPMRHYSFVNPPYSY
eukprot:TRINITY_DN33369_c0_g1_i1.p1 TRINITY_DN33369_c0_g1~~TRINITY_DN33369_c0_g1_i1.p1  ORF type:complete len:111 (-),score=13.82 TRINITY_DN33369_c0_g1_i1:18-350(-)